MRIVLFLISCLGIACAKDWWENGNFYQIYPRSFKDSDGDGIGDINGVTQKLQYLKELGISGTWLSPIFKSPMADFGYDISDYYQIQPEYGTMEDFENLLAKAKELGIRIILDFVPNHTSDENEWFIKSVDGDPFYKDFYVWHDGVIDSVTGERKPPSNWVSIFRYGAWEWNDVREQYYLHQFAVKQPDLNYRNPNVVKEMKNVLKFWFAKGVSGFRIDAIPFLFEIEEDAITGTYKDEKVAAGNLCPDPDDNCHWEHVNTQDQPETFDMIYQWREVADQFKKDHGGDTRILMTEAYTSLDNMIRFYGNGQRNGSHVPFNFALMTNTNNASNAVDFSNSIDLWLDKLPAGSYANWVLGNHDSRRVASRYGKNRADLLNILLQTLPGIAVTYNGEELAMTDVYIPWEDTVDPQACNTNPDNFNSYSRDPARTPFQWDASSNAGFTTASSTWLPVSADYKTNNELMQSRAPISHLQVFKKLVKVRQEPSFQVGTLDKKTIGNDILIYKREKKGSDAYVVILNLGTQNATINISEQFSTIGSLVEIITSSIQSKYSDGEIVATKNFVVEPQVGIVVVDVK